MATKDRTSLKNEFKNGNLATGERFADLIDSVKVVQLPVVDPQALGSSSSFIDSISQDADGKITATKKNVQVVYAQIQDKPTINGVTLMGDKTPAQLGIATAEQVGALSEKVDKLPTGYYYGKFSSVEDLPEATEKGYAYVASSDPTVFYTYLVSGAGAEWVDSGNKMVNTIDITTPKTTETELSKGEKYYASANINDRPAVMEDETNIVKALGYRVLNSNLTFAEQVTAANTIYEIKDEFDLNNGSVTIPAGCTLKFNGGRLINGTIVGVDTLIVGESVKFDKLEGSFVCPIYSTYSTMVADFEKIEMLLKLSIDSLYIDEDYTLTSLPRLVESTHINNIYGGGHEIKSTADSVLPRVFELHVKYIDGLTFNYTEHDVVTPLKIFGVESLKIENINVKNINRTREVAAGVVGVNVYIADGCVLNIDKFSAENLISNGNTTIGDGWGGVIGLYVNVGDRCSVTINNASFEDIKNVEDGQEYLEDAVGLYVHYTNIAQNTSTLDINNLYGRDFGKRLLKTDASNITLNNVEAYNTTDYCLAVLGFNAGDQPNRPSNLVIRNVYFEGRAQYVFAPDMENVVIENATIKYDNTYTKLVSGISVSSVKSKTTVKNVAYSGKNMMIFYRTNAGIVGFDSCVFNVENLYILNKDGNVDFKNCEFVTQRSIILSEASGVSTSSIEFNKCNFECLGSNYEGVLYNSAFLKVGSLIVKDCIFNVNNTLGIFNVFVEKKCIVENNQITFSENTSSSGNVKVIGTVDNVANNDDLVCSLKNNVIVSTLKPSAYDYRVINHNTNKVKVDVDAGYRVILTDVYTDSPVIYYYTSTPQQIDGSRALINVSNVVGRVDMTYDGGWTLSKPSTYTLDEAVRISTAKTMKVGASVFCSTINKPIYWDGSAWVDSNGETVGLQVSDTSVLIGAAADSSTINVYHANALTVSALNPDNTPATWLTVPSTIAVGTNILTISAAANTASNPRGAKVIISDGTDVVIVNVVQNYSTT